MASQPVTAADPLADLPEADFAGPRRRLVGWQAYLVTRFAVAFTLFHLVVLNLYPIDPWLLRAIHVSAASVLIFALYDTGRGGRDRIPWWDWVAMAAAVACAVYVYVELDGLLFRAGAIYTPGDVILGVAGTLIALEAARRTAGPALPIIAGIFILYAFIGPWLPGVLYHRGYDPARFFTYIVSDQGILGITTSVSSTYLVLFVAFGAFLQVSRVGDYFNDLAMALLGWSRGGPAKATVISGVLFGTISGSSVANVVASGTFTIPMMRRVGYDKETAGAIEATSSTGGQITPPVLGAGAFLMAEITGIPYSQIALAAVVPCLLFYIACYTHVELNARKLGLTGLPLAELPSLRAMLRKLYLFAPLAVLVTTLLMGYSVFRAGTLGIIVAIGISWLDRAHAVGPRRVLKGLDQAARDVLQLVAVCACAGIIVGVIALTGIGGRFSQLMLGLAAGSEVLAMLFAMLIAIVLGMGMPTTAAYAIAAAVVAPGLMRLGIEPLVAHMFIFYYAVLSAITPPVALASFAAAAMARADPWRTSVVAVKIGLATFIVPFMFFVSPLLLGQGDLPAVIGVTATASLGVVMLACATEGWLAGKLRLLPRVMLFAGSLCLIVPEPVTDGLGLGLGAGALLLDWAGRRRRSRS